MYCFIFDSEKNYVGLYEYFTVQHIENFILNHPGSTHFFLMNEAPSEGGLYAMSPDGLSVQRGHFEIVDNSTYVQRTFWWEKYTEPGNVPSGMELQISANLLWIYNGGSEETVPNPMPETQVLNYNIVENWVVDEVIVPDEIY